MKQFIVIQILIFWILVMVGAIFAVRSGWIHSLIKSVQVEPPPKPAPKPVVKAPEPERKPEPIKPAFTHDSNPFLRPEVAQTRNVNTWISQALVADRMAAEIVDALLDRPTTVIWLFDGTVSARMLRQEIVMRLHGAYLMLSDMQAQQHDAFKSGKDALQTVVGTFGQGVNFATEKPLTDREEILNVMKTLSEELGDRENPFGAIKQAVAQYAKPSGGQRRRVLVIVVSDEAGDDPDQCDELITLLDKQAIPVYVIGVPAAFGRMEGLYPATSQEFGKPVNQGPESCESEVLSLQDWQGDSQPLDSGFGPWALSRLCAKTGGMYFATRPAEDFGEFAFSFKQMAIVRFDPKVMAAYRPDYISTAAYKALVEESKTRQALLAAVKLPPLALATDLKTTFVKKDEPSLKRALDEAQRAAARVEPKLRELFTVIAAGEADRPKLTGARWQADFDLAMGRVLAARARTEGYNAYLAQLKLGRNFPDASHTTWELKPSATATGDSTLERTIKQARTYLERVLKDNAGTPWAYLAKRELDMPMGWEWTSH